MHRNCIILFFYFLFVSSSLVVYGQTEEVELMVKSIPFDSSVADNSDVFTRDEEQLLREYIEQVQKETSLEFAVCSVESIGHQNLHQVATTALKRWHIGEERKNGVLFLLVSGERRVYIATGKGLRKYLKDNQVKLTLEIQVVPELRIGQYYKGVKSGIDAIVDDLNGTPIAKPSRMFSTKRLLRGIPLLIVVLTIGLVVYALQKAKKQRV